MDLRVAEVLETIKTRFHEPLTVGDLAERVNLSSSRLSSLFKEEVGHSVKQAQKDERLARAASLLARSNLRISQIAYGVGFNDLSNFSRAFKKRTGRTPKQYRRAFGRAVFFMKRWRGPRDYRPQVEAVDESGRQIGICGKMQAHRRGILHRAFSVFVFNRRGELLVQRRASGKYHSGGLWSNTCCSHPRPAAVLGREAQRRLVEEMGFSCRLREVFTFVYSALLDKGLREHEFDHVLAGRYDGVPEPNPREVENWAWMGLPALRRRMREAPADFTAWLKVCLEPAVRRCAALGLTRRERPGKRPREAVGRYHHSP